MTFLAQQTQKIKISTKDGVLFRIEYNGQIRNFTRTESFWLGKDDDYIYIESIEDGFKIWDNEHRLLGTRSFRQDKYKTYVSPIQSNSKISFDKQIMYKDRQRFNPVIPKSTLNNDDIDYDNVYNYNHNFTKPEEVYDTRDYQKQVSYFVQQPGNRQNMTTYEGTYGSDMNTYNTDQYIHQDFQYPDYTRSFFQGQYK